MPATNPAERSPHSVGNLGGSIFLSRIMGLVREQVIGRTLGASHLSCLPK